MIRTLVRMFLIVLGVLSALVGLSGAVIFSLVVFTPYYVLGGPSGIEWWLLLYGLVLMGFACVLIRLSFRLRT